jgi:glycosyltransferase involved in cell wall biosynthesis
MRKKVMPLSQPKIDVVIAVQNEAFKLQTCCRELLKKVPINNLIIVVGESKDNTLEIANKYADIVINDENKGIGYARSLGLEKVVTDYYASIDSDVILSKDWYSWCRNTIQQPCVAACEGYPRPLGPRCAKSQRLDLKNPYCSLGNTMLKTHVIREVGMPLVAFGEDHILKERLGSRGYNWVVNFDLLSIHLVNDLDMLKHYIKFGKSLGRHQNTSYSDLTKGILWSINDFATQLSNFGLSLSTFILLLRLIGKFSAVYGKLKK